METVRLHRMHKWRPNYYSFIQMLIGLISLIFVWKSFCIFRMLTRLVRLIITKIKEYLIGSHFCIRYGATLATGRAWRERQIATWGREELSGFCPNLTIFGYLHCARRRQVKFPLSFKNAVDFSLRILEDSIPTTVHYAILFSFCCDYRSLRVRVLLFFFQRLQVYSQHALDDVEKPHLEYLILLFSSN